MKHYRIKLWYQVITKCKILLFFRSLLAILDPLHCHINFKNQLVTFHKNLSQDSDKLHSVYWLLLEELMTTLSIARKQLNVLKFFFFQWKLDNYKILVKRDIHLTVTTPGQRTLDDWGLYLSFNKSFCLTLGNSHFLV